MAGLGPDISSEDEIKITYLWSKNGKRRTIPVWFTVHESKLELLPMHGLRTKWFVDVQKSGRLELTVKDWRKEASPAVVRDLQRIKGIKQRFAAKYGEGDVNRYYPAQDVALEVAI
jgi:hypothetical protein